jgi:hypothetical protein
MKVVAALILELLLVGGCATAQDSATGNPDALSKISPKSTGVVELAQPKDVADLSEKPSIAGRVDCSEDGSIYTFIDGYAPNRAPNPNDRRAIAAIHPDGTVTSFPWRSVSGFTDVSLPKSVFVGNGRLYVLVEASRESAVDSPLRYPLILIFDSKGSLQGTTVLDHNLNPVVIGVFPSGNMVLVSEDRLSNRMALRVVGSDGSFIRELPLNEYDFVTRAAQMPAAGGVTGSYSRLLLIAMSKFFSYGANLLFVPLETSGLPILELGEHGIVQAVVPKLPDKMVIENFISATGTTIDLRLGNVVETDGKGALDSQNKRISIGTHPSSQITEYALNDGSVIREFDIGSATQAACGTKGTFHFLTSSVAAGNLQVVTGLVRSDP